MTKALHEARKELFIRAERLMHEAWCILVLLETTEYDIDDIKVLTGKRDLLKQAAEIR